MTHPQHERAVYEAVLSGEMEIDGHGQIWRLKKRTFDRWAGGVRTTPCNRVRAEVSSGDGYLQVRLMRDGKRVAAAAHRLVWLHFKGPIPDGMTINHKSGNKANNRPGNLELATYSEQRIHAIQELGAKHHDVRGSKHPKTHLTEADVIDMRRRRKLGEMVKALALRFGVTQKAASAICRGATWKHVPI